MSILPQLLLHDTVVRNLKGNGWKKLDARAREETIETCFRYWRKNGFPYYCLSEAEIRYEYVRLTRVSKARVFANNHIRLQMAGQRLANHFHPQMWSVRVGRYRSPMDCFMDDASLRALIRRAFMVFPDRYSVNASNMRRMLRTFNNTASVSNFRPAAAKGIYEKFTDDSDWILDFSAGYGGRLLGCLPLDRKYVGIDPCRAQIRGMREMVACVGSLAPIRAEAEIIQGCAEDVMPTLPSKQFSLVFSSPPYFNLERYSNEPTQSYIRYPTYAQWLENFLYPVMFEGWRVLRPGGFLIINIANTSQWRLAGDLEQFASRQFTLQTVLWLRLSNKPYFRRYSKSTHKVEPVFVFQKKA